MRQTKFETFQKDESDLLRVAILTSGYPPAKLAGGPIRTLAALIAMQPARCRSLTVTSDRELGGREKLRVPSNQLLGPDNKQTLYVSMDRPLAVRDSYVSLRRFRPTVLYLNSFFDPTFSILPILVHALRLLAAPTLLIAPRGEFSSGALAIKANKKRLYLLVFKALRLHRRVIWHASSLDEKCSIQNVFGRSARVLVHEDETDLPEFGAFTPQRISSSSLRIIFLSRLSEKKGLHRLLASLHHVDRPIDLKVFGFIEDRSYFGRCEQIAKTLPPNINYEYCGPVDPEEVPGTFAWFDLFVFPSAGENFGHVIAESLSVGCPVMCADNTPWTHWLNEGAGTVVPSLDSLAWAKAITDYGSCSAEELEARRQRAAVVYSEWRSQDKGPHIFDLVREN